MQGTDTLDPQYQCRYKNFCDVTGFFNYEILKISALQRVPDYL